MQLSQTLDTLCVRLSGRGWVLGASVLLVAAVVLNAWVSDDAYITFRTCYNLCHGYGPVFNVGERVQTFTNPLWMLLVSGVYFFTGEAYFTSIGMSIICLLGTLWLVNEKLLPRSWAGMVVCLLLCWSCSFVEYATSGLENVLNGMLLATFYVLWKRGTADLKSLRTLAFIAALGMVCRMDTALLYLPAVAWSLWQVRSLRAVWVLWQGLLPFLLWEVFSLIYYGFPFPNTAYAKLSAGLPPSTYWQQGLWYYLNLLQQDPLSLGLMAAGWVAILAKFRNWPLGLGVVLYELYILRIGGDFMGGRFFYLPVLGSALLLGLALRDQSKLLLVIAPLLLIGVLNWRAPLYDYWQKQQNRSELIDDHGIADERGWYYEASGLSAYKPDMWVLQMEENLDRVADDPNQKGVLFWDFLGYMGYGAGPYKHLVDRYALADPLLARLPMSDMPDWRPGHLERVLPIGYRSTLRSGENRIEDQQLAEYYNRLRRVISGPLFTVKRWSEIYHFNLFKYDRLIDKDYYRHPSELSVKSSVVAQPRQVWESFGTEGQVRMYSNRPLTVKFPNIVRADTLWVSVQSEVDYLLDFFLADSVVGNLRLEQQWIGGGLASYRVGVPPGVRMSGFDALRFEGLGGSEHYSLGHVVVLNEESK